MTIHDLSLAAEDIRCASRAVINPDWFFAPRGSEQQLAAKALCARCALAAMCAAMALREHFSAGVFGGLDEADRAGLHRAAGGSPP